MQKRCGFLDSTGAIGMTRTETMAIRTISFLTRLNSSVNGNPRFRIHFDDGSSAITSSDSMLCYGLENKENIGNPVEVTFTRAGRVSDVRPTTR